MRLSTGLISFILILLFSCQSKTGKENLSEKSEQKISVFAAASLADVMSKLAKEYQTKSGVKGSIEFRFFRNIGPADAGRCNSRNLPFSQPAMDEIRLPRWFCRFKQHVFRWPGIVWLLLFQRIVASTHCLSLQRSIFQTRFNGTVSNWRSGSRSGRAICR